MRFIRLILAKSAFGLAWTLFSVILLIGCSRNPAAAVAAVLDRAREPDVDQQTLETTVTALADLGPEAVEPILQGMSDEDYNISNVCELALLSMQGAESKITAIALSQQSQRRLRFNALFVIRDSHFQTRDSSLATLMSDPEPKIRWAAAGCASRGDPDRLSPALFRLLKSRQRTDVIAATYSLARLLRKKAASSLAELLVNSDAQIAGAAADALAEIRSLEHAKPIAKLLGSRDLALRVRALRDLEWMNSPVSDIETAKALQRLPSRQQAELISQILPTSKGLIRLVVRNLGKSSDPAVSQAVRTLRAKKWQGEAIDTGK